MALKIVKFRQVGNSSSQDFWVNFVYFLPNFAGIWLKIDEICLSLENSWLDELHEPHCNKLGLKNHKITISQKNGVKNQKFGVQKQNFWCKNAKNWCKKTRKFGVKTNNFRVKKTKILV